MSRPSPDGSFHLRLDMHDKLYDLLSKMPRHNLIVLLGESLDYMQHYNGRTKSECIISALGGQMREIEGGGIQFRLPSLKEAKKNTEAMGIW